MQRLHQVLICDDDEQFHLALKYATRGRFECRSAYNSDEAMVFAKKQPFDIILLDVQMRRPEEGLEAIPRFREIDPDVAIVMCSGMTDFKVVREAMRLGATDYVPKDFNADELIITLEQALQRRTFVQRQSQQDFEVQSEQRRHPLVGSGKKMEELRKTVEKIRGSAANVLITGETGSGKEIVARQLRTRRGDGTFAPFVAVDSSTIQSTMAESLLFGHEKGAFTGALQTTKGIFEEANGGVVYFDEIGNMSLEIQAKLLRVLQEKEVVRVGSSRPIALEFRVVGATNKSLDEMAQAGFFKADLLQRLNVLPLEVPPLRERVEDIPELVQHFLATHAKLRRLSFTPEALEALGAYPWPGNVREFSNLVAYVAAMVESDEIDVADLPPRIRDHSLRRRTDSAVGECDFYGEVGRFEKELLTREYERTDGNVSRLALRLSMDRSHLYTKLKEQRIHRPKGREQN